MTAISASPPPSPPQRNWPRQWRSSASAPDWLRWSGCWDEYFRHHRAGDDRSLQLPHRRSGQAGLCGPEDPGGRAGEGGHSAQRLFRPDLPGPWDGQGPDRGHSRFPT